jgi:hypothetical protein
MNGVIAEVVCVCVDAGVGGTTPVPESVRSALATVAGSA